MSNRKWQGEDGHILTAFLMLYLDGEAAGDEAAVATHLHECWTCRERMEWLNQGVLTFIDYYRRVLVPATPVVGEQPALLRLVRAEAALPLEPRWVALRRHFSHALTQVAVPVWATAALSVFLLIALPWFGVVEPAKLTAGEFLQRVCGRSALTARQAAASSPRRVRIRRGRQVFSREFAAGVRPALAAKPNPDAKPDPDMIAALQRAQIDWQDPLNPLNFARWHRSVASPRDAIRESQLSITLETTLPAASNLRSVSFTVDRVDWHPTAEHVEFPGEPAIDVDELPAQPAAPTTVARTFRPAPPALPDAAPSGPTPEQLDDSEVQLREVLHSLQADISTAPVIRREDGAVSLVAFASSPRQRDEIAQAISDIPFLTQRILAPGQSAASVIPAPAAPSAPRETAAHDRGKIRAPLADSLRRYCGGLEEANSYLAALAEAHSETLMAASALQSLASRYTPADWNRLSPDLQVRLNHLIEDHLARLRRSARSYDALASPVLDAMLRETGLDANSSAAHSSAACCRVWREESPAVAAQVQRIHSNLTQLFAGGDPAIGASPVNALLECDRARVELKRLLPIP